MNKAAKVGLPTAIAIVIANMVGTGVFGSLGFQVIDISTGFPILMLWLIGGVLSFCGAVCYAELAAMFPKSGGEYHLLSESWHPFAGFLSGWVSATVGFAAPVALNATLMGTYLGSITSLPPLVFALPVVVLISLIHLGRLTVIGKFQMAFTYSKIALIVVLGAMGFLIGTGQPVSFLPQKGDGEMLLSSSFAVSLVYVLYAYTGWNAATYMIDEVRNAKRNVPLALLIGTVFVTVLYVFLNAAFFYSTPIEKMKGQPEVGLIAAKEILGDRGGMIMGILISFGLISTISSMTWAGPRVMAAMGRDHRAFSFFDKKNQNGVPVIAVLVQTVFVIIMVVTATFEQLVHYVQALLTISSILVVLGVIWMRWKRPDAERPYRAWGYPVTPILFAAFSIYVLIFQVQERTKEFLFGLGTLAVGALVYLILQKVASDKTKKKG